MRDSNILFESVRRKLNGKKVYEVWNNFNTVPYLSLDIGEQLFIAREYEYKTSVKENRRCQPLREYELSIFCPHALVSRNSVIWSTDIDYDLANWSYHRGEPIFNMDVVPYLMGGTIVDIVRTEISLEINFDNDVTLVIYPYRIKPEGAIIEEFYCDPNVDASEDVIPSEAWVFDHADRQIFSFSNGDVTVESPQDHDRYVDPSTGEVVK